MRLLAIDPGKTVGWALIEDGQLVKLGTYKPIGDTPSDKLWAFQYFFLWEKNDAGYDAIAWEYQFTSARAKDLWEGQAQIKELVALAAGKGIPTCALTPGEWKSLIAGNGRATYAQVKRVLRLRAEADGWELPKRITDHEVAAIGIGLAAWAKRFQFEAKGKTTGEIEIRSE